MTALGKGMVQSADLGRVRLGRKCLMQSILCCLQQHCQVGAGLLPLFPAASLLHPLPWAGSSPSSALGGTLHPLPWVRGLPLHPSFEAKRAPLHPLPWGGCLYLHPPLPRLSWALPQGLRAPSLPAMIPDL